MALKVPTRMTSRVNRPTMKKIKTIKKTSARSSNSNSGPTKQQGKARALSRVKNATARAAISKSPGKQFPAGSLAQAKANIANMVKTGGSAPTRVNTKLVKKAIATQRRYK